MIHGFNAKCKFLKYEGFIRKMNIYQKTTCFTNNDDSFQYLSTLVRRPFTLVYVKEKAFVMHETTVFFKKTLRSELY